MQKAITQQTAPWPIPPAHSLPACTCAILCMSEVEGEAMVARVAMAASSRCFSAALSFLARSSCSSSISTSMARLAYNEESKVLLLVSLVMQRL